MISGSLVAIVTPMKADGAVDFDGLSSLIDWHIEAGTDGLVITGTTGESATLSKPEHIAVIEAAVAAVAGRIPVIAGTGSNSTAQTVELSQAVDELGVDGYLVVTPYYNKPTQQGLVQHFAAVADAVSKPVILYNVPGRTGVDMVPQTVGELASHERIVGIKEATGEVSRVEVLREYCGADFFLYSGDDLTARAFLLAGGQGVISVTANVAPQAMSDMCKAALAGDADQAGRLDEPLAGLHRDLFIEANPIPVKWALNRMGRIESGIRLPLLVLSDSSIPMVEAALIKAGLLEG